MPACCCLPVLDTSLPQCHRCCIRAQDLQDRDRRDSSRSTAPMRAADDAVILDTSNLSAAEVLTNASDIIRKACPWLQQQQH